MNNKANRNSNVISYNFSNDKDRVLYEREFTSKTEGRQITLKNKLKLIESTNEGIYFLMGKENNILDSFFIPYYSDSSYAQYPGWAKVYYKKK